MKPVYAWHFVGDTLRDYRPLPKDGEWLKHTGSLIMCSTGLHASIRPIDALRYAPGHTLCRVALRGDMIKDKDKLVATERKIIWRIDAEELLRAFARWCAIQVLDNWESPPPKSVIRYLLTGQQRAAAGSAVGSAVWYAVRSAARSAAGSAAESAAESVQNKALKEFIQEARQGYNHWEFTL